MGECLSGRPSHLRSARISFSDQFSQPQGHSCDKIGSAAASRSLLPDSEQSRCEPLLKCGQIVSRLCRTAIPYHNGEFDQSFSHQVGYDLLSCGFITALKIKNDSLHATMMQYTAIIAGTSAHPLGGLAVRGQPRVPADAHDIAGAA